MADAVSVSVPVVQANHGFSRGAVVRFNGSNWVIDTSGAAGCGLVGSITDNNVFEFVQIGKLDGLSGLVPGSQYFSSSTGELSLTPSGTAVGIAYDETSIFVQPVTQQAAGINLDAFVTDAELSSAMLNEIARANSTYLEETQAGAAGLQVLATTTEKEAREAIQVQPVDVTLAYTGESLTSMTDTYGTRMFSYDMSGQLIGIVGTGKYPSKTFNYTLGQLTSIDVI